MQPMNPPDAVDLKAYAIKAAADQVRGGLNHLAAEIQEPQPIVDKIAAAQAALSEVYSYAEGTWEAAGQSQAQQTDVTVPPPVPQPGPEKGQQ